jgi:hypothetical protein
MIRALWINLINTDQIVLENNIILTINLGPEHSGWRCVLNDENLKMHDDIINIE